MKVTQATDQVLHEQTDRKTVRELETDKDFGPPLTLKGTLVIFLLLFVL